MNDERTVRDAVRDSIDVLRVHAVKSERDRRLAPEVVEVLADTGVFTAPVPARYGGLQIPLPAQVDLLTELARGCGSAAWCTAIYFTGAWATGLFPAEALDEVHAGRQPRISIASSPSGTLTRSGGDHLLDGTWGFNTGIHHADWDLLGARLDGRHVLVLVPTSAVTVHDDWYTSGLQGTGSCTVSVTATRVPAHRVLPFPDNDHVRSPDHPDATTDSYWYELYPLFSALNAGPPVGLARAAAEFLDGHVRGRGITFTRHAHQHEAAITHRQISEIVLKCLAATALRDRMTARVHSRAVERGTHTLAERAETRAVAAYSTRLARQAVELAQAAAGASANRRDVPIQRIARDATAMSLHAALAYDPAIEIHGRVLLDLDPETAFL